MNDLAKIPPKPKRITRKVRAAVAALVGGECKTITAAAEKAGLSREGLSRALAEPHISSYLKDRVMKNLALSAARAGAVKVDLLDCDSERVRDLASSFVLGLAGIRPASSPSINLNIELKAGYVIDLRDDLEIIDAKAIPHG